MELPFHLHYVLNRRQRLIPHLFVWMPYLVWMGLMALGVVCLALYVPPGWALFAALAWLWLSRGFLVGIILVARRPLQPMDIEVRENALGFNDGTGQWWFNLDGLIRINRFQADTWTLRHYNGAVIHISAEAITPEQMEHIRSAARRGLLREVPPEE